MTRKRHPIKKQDAYKAWGSWQYLNLNGQVRRGIEFPRRERATLRVALSRIGCRYREIVPVFNVAWAGRTGSNPGGVLQWLDFVILHPTYKRIGVILFIPGNRWEKHKMDALRAKQIYLERKGIPYIVVNRKDTSQVYEIIIRRWMKKEADWRR